jgi:hypothetical protein
MAKGETLYTVRVSGASFQPRVYAAGKYTVLVGRDKPEVLAIAGLEAKEKSAAGKKSVRL